MRAKYHFNNLIVNANRAKEVIEKKKEGEQTKEPNVFHNDKVNNFIYCMT
jgi:hypothetical protein